MNSNSTVPLAPQPISLAQSSWNALILEYETRLAAEQNFDRNTYRPACQDQGRGDSPLPADIAQESDRLAELRCGAEEAAVLAMAPNLPCVIWKIEMARERWADFCDWPDGWWKAIMSDLHRIAVREIA